MDAQIKEAKMIPARYDKEGEIKKAEHGRLVLEVPLDDKTNIGEFLKIAGILDKEWVTVNLSTEIQIPDQEEV